MLRPYISFNTVVYGVFAFVATGFVVGLLSPPYVHWRGPAPRTLWFRVIDADSREPIAGARVALVRPRDPEGPPDEAETDGDGLVRRDGVFIEAGGREGRNTRKVAYFGYGSWAVIVRAGGYADGNFFLGDHYAEPDDKRVFRTLDLMDHPPTSVVLPLTPMVGAPATPAGPP